VAVEFVGEHSSVERSARDAREEPSSRPGRCADSGWIQPVVQLLPDQVGESRRHLKELVTDSQMYSVDALVDVRRR
jgi:hypothetical protein